MKNLLGVFQEEAKALKKRNVKALKDILSNMSKVTYRTTWQEAQRLLLDNVDFVNDTELQSNKILFIFFKAFSLLFI